METSHQYCYSKGKMVTKAVLYTLFSALAVAFGVYSFVHWELSFLFSDWKGYVIIIVYGLITLGMILSAFEAFGKAGMAFRGIPAFGVETDHFVTYDRRGLAQRIPFEDCEQVRFKTNYHYRGMPPTLTLIIRYHHRNDPQKTEKVEYKLAEFDRPQHEIDKQLNKVYKNYKKNTSCG